MHNQTLEYDDKQYKARLIIRPATLVDGLVRDQLTMDAFANKTEPNPSDIREQVKRTAQIVIYPACMAAASGAIFLLESKNPDEPHNLPIPFETFADLPEALVREWADKTYQENPQWLNGAGPDELPEGNQEEAKKKA